MSHIPAFTLHAPAQHHRALVSIRFHSHWG